VRVPLLLLLACLISWVACANNEPTYVGERPPATSGGGPYNPGNPPPSSGSGSGTGSTGAGAGGGMPTCEDALKQCPYTFTHPAGPTSVELRGSFAPDGWTTGVPLTLVNGTWQVEVFLAWDVPVEYKFVLDGTNWVTDPNNPTQVDDGFGGLNSYLDGVTCDDWICSE